MLYDQGISLRRSGYPTCLYLENLENLDQSFQRQGPKLFNSVPAQIRNLSGCGVAAFKSQLDEYLAELYDEPQLPGLTPRGIDEQGAASNSVIYQKRKEAGDCENGRFPQLRKRAPG